MGEMYNVIYLLPQYGGSKTYGEIVGKPMRAITAWRARKNDTGEWEDIVNEYTIKGLMNTAINPLMAVNHYDLPDGEYRWWDGKEQRFIIDRGKPDPIQEVRDKIRTTQEFIDSRPTEPGYPYHDPPAPFCGDWWDMRNLARWDSWVKWVYGYSPVYTRKGERREMFFRALQADMLNWHDIGCVVTSRTDLFWLLSAWQQHGLTVRTGSSENDGVGFKLTPEGKLILGLHFMEGVPLF